MKSPFESIENKAKTPLINHDPGSPGRAARTLYTNQQDMYKTRNDHKRSIKSTNEAREVLPNCRYSASIIEKSETQKNLQKSTESKQNEKPLLEMLNVSQINNQ